MKRTSRKPSKLSSSLQRHLNAYALAASAAGVGMLVLAQSASAKIIYTKADKSVFGFRIPLDLNHDGITDFWFGTWVSVTTGWSFHGVVVDGALASNAIGSVNKWPAALRAGARVGPSAHFYVGTVDMMMGGVGRNTLNGHHYYSGLWENGGKGVKDRYLGLRFHVHGKTHYGWARLNFPSPQGATLTGYAYETIPNKPIITGKTKGPDVITVHSGSLGALAAGRK